MTDYWRCKIGDEAVWLVDTGSGPYEVKSGHGPPHPNLGPVPRGADVPSALVAVHGQGAAAEKASLGAGKYHPRMWRPKCAPRIATYTQPWLNSVHAIRLILERLADASRVVEPSDANQASYGHEFRHLLILACTEVESACKAVLTANGYPTPANDQWSTRDYVKVRTPLRLSDWIVGLTRHPHYPTLRPFHGWDPRRATKSLEWYHAYNTTKHDREGQLSLARMQHAIQASAAAYILVRAQFGQFGFVGFRTHEIDFFQVVKEPVWQPREHYVPPEIEQGCTWAPVNYSF